MKKWKLFSILKQLKDEIMSQLSEPFIGSYAFTDKLLQLSVEVDYKFVYKYFLFHGCYVKEYGTSFK